MSYVKNFYKNYNDEIKSKRFDSPFPLRRYVHRVKYSSIVKNIKEIVESEKNKNIKILDAGCGDGLLAIFLAKEGFSVTGCDISQANIENAKKISEQEKTIEKTNFIEADASSLPFEDSSFDIVISSHVLEHLEDFNAGLNELKRVAKKTVIIALPTCLNPCSFAQLGGDTFWKLSKRSPFSLFIGFARVIKNIFNIGVNEGYAGEKSLPHISFYPWVMRKKFKKAGFRIAHFEADSICLPYFNFLLPVVKFLDKFKAKPILRNFGYGSFAILEKV